MLVGMLALVAGSLVINEILYDPPGVDGGQEFVELFNPGSTAFSWSTMRLEAGDGAQPGSWRRVWEYGAGTLASAGFLVIGGAAVPEATHLLTGSLQNGPDALRLLVDEGLVDLVGYGSLSDASLYETSPAEDVTSQSLSRIPDGQDTQDNALDLQARPPTPGRHNQPQLEWQLQILQPPWHQFWPGRRLHVQAVLRNNGSASTTPADWQLRAQLQQLQEPLQEEQRPRSAATELQVLRLPDARAAGDSSILEVAWSGENGLFALTLETMGHDEWLGDNRVELVGRVGSGAVVINEILYAPLDAMPEWVELRNRSSWHVDLSGWTLTDASGRAATLQVSRSLAPDSFAVLSDDSQQTVPQEASGALSVEARPWPSLNNTDNDLGIADILVLRDAGGLLQDAVFYSGSNTVRGRSLERVHADADVRGVLWSLSKDPQGATPGRENSVAGGAVGGGSVDVQPNPISPDGDGFNDVLQIRLQVPEGQEGFRARLFDLEGRLRREIAGDQLGPGERHFLWDGTDDSGELVELGVYLLHFELFGKSPGVTRLLRTVGVVRP